MVTNLTAVLQDMDRKHHIHPFTDSKSLNEKGVRIITKAEGCHMWTSEGERVLDGMAGLWCVNIGYGRKELADVAYQQMLELPYYNTFFQTSTQPATELSAKLAEITPEGLNHVFYANSGSEANDTIAKMVRWYWNTKGQPKKKTIISRVNAYHGVTMAAASLCGLFGMHPQFDLPLQGFVHADCPHWYRFGGDMDPEEFGLQAARSVENMILSLGAENVGAFIGEPIMGAGGVLVPPASYWPEVQRICRKHDVLVIADEVICGFGRTGNMWGSQTFGIKPDILTCAKALSSAYLPISAVMISEEIFQGLRGNSEKLGLFGHGYTYSAHPACAAVALRTQELMQERDIIGHVKAVSPHFQKRIAKLGEHELVGHARGVGLIGAVEIVADKATKRSYDPAAKIGALIQNACQEHGLITRAMPGDILGFCPPLIITSDEIDEMFDRFTNALDETARQIKQEGASAAQ